MEEIGANVEEKNHHHHDDEEEHHHKESQVAATVSSHDEPGTAERGNNSSQNIFSNTAASGHNRNHNDPSTMTPKPALYESSVKGILDTIAAMAAAANDDEDVVGSETNATRSRPSNEKSTSNKSDGNNDEFHDSVSNPDELPLSLKRQSSSRREILADDECDFSNSLTGRFLDEMSKLGYENYDTKISKTEPEDDPESEQVHEHEHEHEHDQEQLHEQHEPPQQDQEQKPPQEQTEYKTTTRYQKPPSSIKTSTVITSSSRGSFQPYVKLLNFQTLNRIEQDRLPRYSKELEIARKHWRSCQEILDCLLDEVRHANHLFHISDVSFHQYSQVMYSIHKDIFLDDKGNRVTSSARQQILLKQRGGAENDNRNDPEYRHYQQQRSSMMNASGGTVGYLDPLYKSFAVLADSMILAVRERETDHEKQAATREFIEFSDELMSQAEAMKALGNSVMQEMESSELDIRNSFLVLEQLAAQIKTENSNLFGIMGDPIQLEKPSKDKNFPKQVPFGGVEALVGDWWLWDTLYRSAVKYQQTTWDLNQERLLGVGQSLKFFQQKHQTKLNKAVLAVMPEQRQLFLVGANAFEAALRKTTGSGDVEKAARVDHETVLKEFEEGVQKRSSSLLNKKTHHKSRILNRSRSKYNDAIEQAEDAEPLPTFDSPVQSKLVRETQVVERWENHGWMTTLAVFTVDKYLHLFDCSDMDIKTAPQTAFKLMFPTAASTRSGVHYQGEGRRRARRAFEHKIPKPDLTFNMLTCTIKTYAYSTRSFELNQTADPTAKTQDLPQTTLRFKNFAEAARWYSLLLDIPEPTNVNDGSDKYEPDYGTNQGEDFKVDADREALYDEAEAALGGSHGSHGLSADDLSDRYEEGFEDASEYEEEGTGNEDPTPARAATAAERKAHTATLAPAPGPAASSIDATPAASSSTDAPDAPAAPPKPSAADEYPAEVVSDSTGMDDDDDDGESC